MYSLFTTVIFYYDLQLCVLNFTIISILLKKYLKQAMQRLS